MHHTANAHQNQSSARDTSEGGYDFVVVANRLPVDRSIDEDGNSTWRRSPGGLVSALAPVMAAHSGAWIGWHGASDEDLEPFDHDVFHLVPVPLSEDEVRRYYEGFSNATIWPLYHDVIAPPEFHRTWWDTYRAVNRRFAETAAGSAAQNATVWVQDYQLQLVPAMLRHLRPDLTIGFFDHIPFPPLEIFAQLPWRKQVLTGLLGADLLGFQRPGDASNFRRCCDKILGVQFDDERAEVTQTPQDQNEDEGNERYRRAYTNAMPNVTSRRRARKERLNQDLPTWITRATSYPISIDVEAVTEMASRPSTKRRAEQIRQELGNPETVYLGVDRLDYTKGIRHRLKAYGELLNDGDLTVENSTMIQVASPSRERVASYIELREQIEGMVGRLNGQFDTMAHTAIRYLHHGYPFEEMIALYLATDVLVVSSLRDGMNLVAKEYVVSHLDHTGALVLSEFTGAAEQLPDALQINPHDIDGFKEALLYAKNMSLEERQYRMKAMREQIFAHDVEDWSMRFLDDLARTRDDDLDPEPKTDELPMVGEVDRGHGPFPTPAVEDELQRAASAEKLLIAMDFDGTLAPFTTVPDEARALPLSQSSLEDLAEQPDTFVALISGRPISFLKEVADPHGKMLLSGSHGGEFDYSAMGHSSPELKLTDAQQEALRRATEAVEDLVQRFPGSEIEHKPAGVGFHTRTMADNDAAQTAEAEAVRTLKDIPGVRLSPGQYVVECAVLEVTKGDAMGLFKEFTHADTTIFAGDDLTDENALEALGPQDLGIKVGRAESIARVRVTGPEAMSHALARLAHLRRKHTKTLQEVESATSTD
ncbi:trehalose-phosphatase [Kocuria massiliensis]|uniref:trehalose-phosphatase n=1 Tax=Kocuria massiliensis TaxID=1926282 RepID=UPI0022B9BFC9|nr:trehalose-phosphatase [Kocuria massiliensis]